MQTVDAARVLADQFGQPSADLGRGMAVVGERQDAARLLAPDADEVGDAVDEDAGLAGAGTGEHQHVGQLPVVGDDPGLDRVAQALDDGAPGVRTGLPAQLGAARRPASGRGSSLAPA